ncbi:MAG: hypothetical protein RLZZ501_836 [Pseudomonadota bacterium]|jgi:UDP-2,4-diacetamido-2,4,6-trideoxy-beta-L-altropyranose hydrolase
MKASSPRRAVIRADAGPGIGGGHVCRCLALAAELRATGWEVAFASAAASPATVPALASWPHLILDGPPESEPAMLARRWTEGCDLLVIDHYHRDAGFERACRPWARRILALDDAPGRPHDADLLLDPAPNRTPGDYAEWVPAGCRCLLGPDHVLLRPEFDRWRTWRRTIPPRARRLLVTIGQADPLGLSARLLPLLAAPARSGFEARLVVGGAFPPLPAPPPSPSLTLLYGIDDMAALMAWADLALIAAGGTCWEACRLGLPLLALTVADNQADNAAVLAASGAGRVLGTPAMLDDETLLAALTDLAGDAPARAAMAASGRKLIDGAGRARVVAALEEAE